MKIYYLGPKASYSHILAKQIYPAEELVTVGSFGEITERVLSDSDVVGLLPIENSITSDVHENVDTIFQNSQIRIIKEAYLKIGLHLIGLRLSDLKKIKKVYSHPKALSQASRFLDKHDIKAIDADSTAAGQQIVIETNSENVGAIGSGDLIDKTGLKIIQRNIANEKNNLTRFVVVRSGQTKETISSNKVTVIFKAKHVPGSLARVLVDLARLGANLTKIESRPIPGTNWEYSFWIDMEIEPKKLSDVQISLKKKTLEFSTIGTYTKGKVYNS